jgi:hypothetical protein
MLKRKCAVRVRLRAWRGDNPSRGATLLPGEHVWWDTSQTSDPVVFEIDNLPFKADRANFLTSVEIPAEK